MFSITFELGSVACSSSISGDLVSIHMQRLYSAEVDCEVSGWSNRLPVSEDPRTACEALRDAFLAHHRGA